MSYQPSKIIEAINKLIAQKDIRGIKQSNYPILFPAKKDIMKSLNVTKTKLQFAQDYLFELIEWQQFPVIQWVLDFAVQKNIPFYQAIFYSVLMDSKKVNDWYQLVLDNDFYFIPFNNYQKSLYHHYYYNISLLRYIIKTFDNKSVDEKQKLIKFFQQNKVYNYDFAAWLMLIYVFSIHDVEKNYNVFAPISYWLAEYIVDYPSFNEYGVNQSLSQGLIAVKDFVEFLVDDELNDDVFKHYSDIQHIMRFRGFDLYSGAIDLKEIHYQHHFFSKYLQCSRLFAEKAMEKLNHDELIYWDKDDILPLWKPIIQKYGESQFLHYLWTDYQYFINIEFLKRCLNSSKTVDELLDELKTKKYQQENKQRLNPDWQSFFN